MQRIHSTMGGQRLEDWCTSGPPRDQVVYLYNGAAPLLLEREGQGQRHLPAHWQGLLLAGQGLHIASGEGRVDPLPVARLIGLQCFIDQALVGQPAQHSDWLACLGHPGLAFGDPASLERWYLQQAMQGEPAYQAFAQALRGGESYRLVRFLSTQTTSGGQMQVLAERYGLSVSHFRRLCRRALGSASKTQLSRWRTGRALLAMADQPASLTEVALSLGYASSSHFSKEIRDRLGVRPSRLTDITHLAGQGV